MLDKWKETVQSHYNDAATKFSAATAAHFAAG